MRRPSAHSLLACSLAASTITCTTPPPQILFTVAGKMDVASKACTSNNTVTSVPGASAVRVSVRLRDAAGATLMKDGKPVICDGITDFTKGTVFELPQSMIAAGTKMDLFVEAFDKDKVRLASGAVLGFDPLSVTPGAANNKLPMVRLYPAEKWSCLPGTGTEAGKALRLAQQRSFHTATTLPNGEVLFAYGLTTAATGDAASNKQPEATQEFFATGGIEVFDPATQTFVAVADTGMPAATPRAFHNAAYLDSPAEGQYRILVAGGVAPQKAGSPFVKGAAGGLTMAPVFFRLAIDQANATVAPSEILTYDAKARTITRQPATALQQMQDAALQAGVPLQPGGLLLAGGIPQLANPAPSANIAIAIDPTKPIAGKLAVARAGAGAVAFLDMNGRTSAAILVGGVAADPTSPPDPFERIALGGGMSTALKANGAFPGYMFPTLTAIDAPGAAAPRVLVSGGLEVEKATGHALDPPSSTMQVVKYNAAAAALDVSAPFSGAMLQSACEANTVKRVAWNAATLLASRDGVLSGDRVLLSGGTTAFTCNDCSPTTHTCAVAQSLVVGIVPDGGKLPVAAADPLQVARLGHTQTILPDHTILVAGGLTRTANGTEGAVEAELYNAARARPPTGGTGDADDPLFAELKAANLMRAPGEQIGGTGPAATMSCLSPKH